MKENFLIDYLTTLGPHLAYFILFLGSCVEGESIVLTAGFLAYTGFLELKWVMVIAFFSTLLADQALFFVGHYRGRKILARHPEWQEKTRKIFTLLHKHNVLFILGFRFIYGIRTLSPLVIGAAGVSIERFIVLNLIAAVIWTVISCTGGYLLGYFFADKIEQMIVQVNHYQKVVVLGIGFLAFFVVGGVYIYRKWNASSKKEPGSEKHN